VRPTTRRSGIRDVEERDVPAVVALVHELAEYERAAEHCHLTAGQLHAALFGPAPALFGHVAEVHEGDGGRGAGGAASGTVVGCALWFLNFSTWRGVHGLYLEDLYVQPAHRGAGLGRALLARLAAVCAQRGLERLEWSVLDWNAPSIGFYRALGAVPLDGWTTFRLDGAGLAALGRDDARDPGPAVRD
jgi:GNAT superfamily N-acetyltransferase